jgi:hypothetical protein
MGPPSNTVMVRNAELVDQHFLSAGNKNTGAMQVIRV